jgi:ATP-binding cassette subfamily B protein
MLVMLKILKNYKKKDFAFAAVAVVFIILSVWMELTIPEYMSEITRLVQTPGSEMSDIL